MLNDWLVLEQEISHRHDKRLAARLHYAKLRHRRQWERVSIAAPSAVWTELCSRSWRAAPGSTPMTI